MIRVLLADSDPVVRSALLLALTHRLGVKDVETIADAKSLDKKIAEYQPDLLVLDWELPGLKVVELLKNIREHKKNIKIIVMSVQLENETWALASGADDFLPKRASGEYVVDLLRKYVQD